jgi:hypothetical protein
MLGNTYSLIEKEQQFLRDSQIVRYQYSFPVNVVVPNNKQRQGSITIDQDADYLAEEMTGKCLGPTDVDGKQLPAEGTDFPAQGTLVGWAQSGLQVSIKDGGSGYELTDGFVNCETILTPGYGIQFHAPLKWKYYIRRNTKLVFTFANRDEATPSVAQALYHFVSLSLHGKKYTGKTK